MLGATPQRATPAGPLRPGRRAGGTGRREAREGLLEALLTASDVPMTAQIATDWLVEHAEAGQAGCALLADEGRRLEWVAAAAVSFDRAETLGIEVENGGHPLVRALERGVPVRVPAPVTQCPIGGSLVVYPVPDPTRGARPLGILVAPAPGPVTHADARWLASMLGYKLALLSARERPSTLQARDAAREPRDRALLAAAIDAVTDPVLVTDGDGKLLVANAHASRLFSAPEEASEGRRSAVGLNAILFSASLSALSVQQERGRQELTLVDPTDGTDLLFEHLSTAVKPPGGADRCFVSILRNVTDLGRAQHEIERSYEKLRTAEDAVRAERRRLALLIDSVVDPIVVTDARGDVLLMNAPAAKLFTVGTFDPEEVQRVVRSNDAHFSSFVATLLSRGSDERWRSEIALADPITGRHLPVEAVAGQVLSERGELLAVVSTLHDRTEAMETAGLYDQLKRASDELQAKVQAATAELAEQNELLRRQAIELEQASALKSQFLANMSHEFRTPLNAILGYASMLLQGVSGPLGPPQRKRVQRIQSNGRHLLDLVNDILDITRIEAGRMPLHVERFTIDELLREVLAEIAPIIRGSGLAVSSDVRPRIPGLYTDRKKVKQILVNLLSNAIKFTREGRVTIHASYERRPRQTIVSVEDTGVGIAPGNLDKIFEDFRQLDTTLARPQGGAGLGLAICRRLAIMLGGRITVKSREGEGSTFAVHLPNRLPTRRRTR